MNVNKNHDVYYGVYINSTYLGLPQLDNWELNQRRRPSGREVVAPKVNSRCFKLHCSYSDLL